MDLLNRINRKITDRAVQFVYRSQKSTFSLISHCISAVFLKISIVLHILDNLFIL